MKICFPGLCGNCRGFLRWRGLFWGRLSSADAAEGVQLDLIGETMGVPRSAAADPSDENYRACLKAKLALWRWDGTNETVTEMLDEAFPGKGITLQDNGDMTVTVENADYESLLPIPAGTALV